MIEDVFVPEGRTLANTALEDGQAPGRQINTHPMYGAISSANFTAAMAAPALGAARGFLQRFEERLRSKSSNIEDGLLVNMARFAQASAEVDAVHATALNNARRLRCVPALEVPTEDRAKCRRDNAFIAQSCRKAVNLLYEECGGSGLYEGSELQRFWRDASAASAHHGLTWDWHAVAWTRSTLGLPTPPNFTFTRA